MVVNKDDLLGECAVPLTSSVIKYSMKDQSLGPKCGTISLEIARTSKSVHRKLTTAEKTKMEVVSQSGLHNLPTEKMGERCKSYKDAKGKLPNTSFTMEQAQQLVMLSSAVYFGTVIWAASREHPWRPDNKKGLFGRLKDLGTGIKELCAGEVSDDAAYYNPANMSPNLRYFLGDLTRTKSLTVNHECNVLTLPSSCDHKEDSGVTAVNGVVSDVKNDHQVRNSGGRGRLDLLLLLNFPTPFLRRRSSCSVLTRPRRSWCSAAPMPPTAWRPCSGT
jgi:hypothetical protein